MNDFSGGDTILSDKVTNFRWGESEQHALSMQESIPFQKGSNGSIIFEAVVSRVSVTFQKAANRRRSWKRL